jgi:hypothetical protein
MIDALGYAASSAVLATFLMRTMLPLRLVAIVSNVLFVIYGYAANIEPVLFLHVVLLPINALRLIALRDCPNAQQQPLKLPALGQWIAAQLRLRVARRTVTVEAFDPRHIHDR